MNTVVEPRSAAELADVMRQCAADGVRVQPAGGMTWLHPHDDCVTISTRLMTGLDEYQPEDLTVTAHAGTTLEQLQQEVGRKRQWLALDPPALTGATIGGCAATAAAGPMRALYGTPRDHVLGLDIVTGDGRLLHFGGRVVKNVAGYDMVRPIVGSRGSLGIITSVSIRLRPMPLADVTVAFPVAPAMIGDAGIRAEQAWPVAACELLSPALAEHVIPRAGDGWIFVVRLHGQPAEVAKGRNRLAAAFGVAPVDVGTELWSRLSALEAATRTACRFAAPVTEMGSVLSAANALADHTLNGPPMIAVHAASGIVRMWGTPNGSESHQPRTDAAESVASAGGTSTWPVETLWPRPRASDAVLRLEAGIRRLFDPAGILPPHTA